MKRILIGLSLIALGSTLAAAQTVDEILAKSFDARGGLEAIKGVGSARMSGKMSMGNGMEAPIVLEWKRPDKLRIEFTLQGMTGVQAYDGTTAWQVMPFMGKPDPEPMSEQEAKQVIEQADVIDGPLVDYADKGNTVEYLGEDEVDGTAVHKLKLVEKNGNESVIFLDAEYFMTIKSEATREMQGVEMDTVTNIGDYKEVGALILPYSISVELTDMGMTQSITFDTIELDVELADDRFTMPEVETAEEEATEEEGAGS